MEWLGYGAGNKLRHAKGYNLLETQSRLTHVRVLWRSVFAPSKNLILSRPLPHATLARFRPTHFWTGTALITRSIISCMCTILFQANTRPLANNGTSLIESLLPFQTLHSTAGLYACTTNSLFIGVLPAWSRHFFSFTIRAFGPSLTSSLAWDWK